MQGLKRILEDEGLRMHPDKSVVAAAFWGPGSRSRKKDFHLKHGSRIDLKLAPAVNSLGGMCAAKCSMWPDVLHHLKQATTAWKQIGRKLSHSSTGGSYLSIKTKRQLFMSYMMSRLLDAAETWDPLTAAQRRKLDAYILRKARVISGRHYHEDDCVPNVYLREELDLAPVRYLIRQRQASWLSALLRDESQFLLDIEFGVYNPGDTWEPSAWLNMIMDLAVDMVRFLQANRFLAISGPGLASAQVPALMSGFEQDACSLSSDEDASSASLSSDEDEDAETAWEHKAQLVRPNIQLLRDFLKSKAQVKAFFDEEIDFGAAEPEAISGTWTEQAALSWQGKSRHSCPDCPRDRVHWSSMPAGLAAHRRNQHHYRSLASYFITPGCHVCPICSKDFITFARCRHHFVAGGIKGRRVIHQTPADTLPLPGQGPAL